MALDAFTLNAMFVVLLAALLVAYVVFRSSRHPSSEALDRIAAIERRLTPAAPSPVEPGTRALCGAIHRLYPNARVELDFEVGTGPEGPYIARWLLPVPQPGKDEIAAAARAYAAEQVGQAYQEARLDEYPSIGDQLDALYHARHGDPTALAAIDARIAEVKARHPKPGQC
jgi:hypothetical protein